MGRRIAGLRPVWDTLLLLLAVFLAVDVLTSVLPGVPQVRPPGGLVGVGVLVALFVVLSLLIGVAPRADGEGDREPVVLAPPLRGRWVSLNGPGQQLPSHGTRTRGQYGAIDVCGVAGGSTPPVLRFALRSSRPQDYACFGEPVLSMAAGTVVRVRDGRRDHRARNTWQAFLAMLTIEGLVREMAGTGFVRANPGVVDHADGTFAAYAHLKRGSATVAEGARVAVGEQLGALGNTGNTSMPHLHVQLMDRASVDAAAGLVMRWSDLELTGELDEQLAPYAKDPGDTAVEGMPRNAEIFTAGAQG